VAANIAASVVSIEVSASIGLTAATGVATAVDEVVVVIVATTTEENAAIVVTEEIEAAAATAAAATAAGRLLTRRSPNWDIFAEKGEPYRLAFSVR
jgi:hypothetical protein